MGISKKQPSEWMTHDGTGNSKVFSDKRGWILKMANGCEIILQCINGVTEYIKYKIINVENPIAYEYLIESKDIIRFYVYFDTDVKVTGIPTITFDEAGVKQEAQYQASTSFSDKISFEYVVSTVGEINNVIPKINLNGGNIVSVDGTDVDLNFPNNYAQPKGVTVLK
jgi:hypothetical protein